VKANLDDILLCFGEHVHSDQDGRQNDSCRRNATDCDDQVPFGVVRLCGRRRHLHVGLGRLVKGCEWLISFLLRCGTHYVTVQHTGSELHLASCKISRALDLLILIVIFGIDLVGDDDAFVLKLKRLINSNALTCRR